MTVPKRRKSMRAQEQRRSHDALGAAGARRLPAVSTSRASRIASCGNCGTYRGRTVIETGEE